MADETIILKIEVEGAAESTKATADLTKALENQTQSIAALRAQNKQLTQERNSVDTSTESGRKKIEELNRQLDKNNETIKKNVDSLAKQRLGIGDYSGAIDKLVPGLGSTITGIQGMTKSAAAFIATPIGAVIGAIGVALAALTAYFKGSEEGQDRLAKAMAIGKVIFEAVIQVVEKLGEVIADTLGFLGDLAMKVVNFVAPQVGATLQSAIDAGSQIADLQDKIEADENAFIVKRAEVNKQVAELRAQAIKQEGEAKQATIQQAIQLEQDLAAAETQHVKDKLALLDLENAQTGKLTEEQKKQYAELTAEKINQESQANEATLRFQKEIERLKDEADKKAEARRAIEIDRRAQDEAYQADKLAKEAEKAAALDQQLADDIARIEAKRQAQEDADEAAHQLALKTMAEDLAAEKATVDKEVKYVTDAEKTKTRIAQLEKSNQLATISSTLNQAQALFKQDSFEYKTLGIARATIDTYRAADLALASYPPPWGAIAAGVAIATGLANVAKIAGVGFATGGYTGDGDRYEPAGIVHRGEFVIPKPVVERFGADYFSSRYLPGYADGGLVMNQATQQIDTSQAIANAFKNMPPIYTSWTEGLKINQSITLKESLTSL